MHTDILAPSILQSFIPQSRSSSSDEKKSLEVRSLFGKTNMKEQREETTTKGASSLIRERKAWIGYDFANSCYATVAIATFLPLVLNAYAEAEAWQGKSKPKMCDKLEEAYSEKCLECRVGEGNLLCSGAR